MCLTTSLNHLDGGRGLETWEVFISLELTRSVQVWFSGVLQDDVNLLCKPTLPCMPHIRQEGAGPEAEVPGPCQVSIPSFSTAQQLCMGTAFPRSHNHQQVSLAWKIPQRFAWRNLILPPTTQVPW